MGDVRTISELREKAQKTLFKKANVIGVGVGLKEVEGQQTQDLSLKVLVYDKLPVSALSVQDLIPKELDGIKTDVTNVGRVFALQSPTGRHRPAFPGISVGHYAVTAGTFGAVVRDTRNNKLLILSNNHVLANSNNASAGDAILQPGSADGGRNPQDRIADLERFVKIQFKGGSTPGGGSGCRLAKFTTSLLNFFASASGSNTRVTAVQANAVNLVDAAVAKPVPDSIIIDDILKIGKVQGTVEAAIGMKVKKSGRTTGYTEGQINILDTTIEVGYGGQTAVFEHQILASAMSEPGDSGSLVLDMQNRAVGLLFAGSSSITIMNPIETVLTSLSIAF